MDYGRSDAPCTAQMPRGPVGAFQGLGREGATRSGAGRLRSDDTVMPMHVTLLTTVSRIAALETVYTGWCVCDVLGDRATLNVGACTIAMYYHLQQ